MAAVHATLVGNLDLQDEAEAHLQAALRLTPARSPEARETTLILGRFLNMRSSVLDLGHIDLQASLYETLVDDPAVSSATPEGFATRCFHRAARALQTYDRGHELAAYRQIRALERDLKARMRSHPDEIDTFAMAGNYAITFASAIPVARQRRLQEAVQYLEVQQQRWEGMTPHARDTVTAPNVRTVFAFALAEAAAAAGDEAAARRAYRRVIELTEQPRTTPREQIVAVSRERLEHLPAYLGREELLPPWPSAEAGCVACHSRQAQLPEHGLVLATEELPW
jgi:hypothetical protein